MIVLAIDPGQHTGLCVLDTAAPLYHVHLATLDLRRTDCSGMTVAHAVRQLCDIHRPDLVVVENQHIPRQQGSAKAASQARAAIMVAQVAGAALGAIPLGMLIWFPMATEWRRVIGLSGGASVSRADHKLRARNFAADRKAPIRTEHEADAVCMAWAGAAWLRANPAP